MNSQDRLWVSWTGFMVVFVVRAPTPLPAIAELVWAAAVLTGLIIQLLRHRSQPQTGSVAPAVSESVIPGPVDAIRTQLAAYEAAGFTDAQAKDLLQESLRTAVRQQGGWQP